MESFVYRSAQPDDSQKWVELRSKLIEWGGQKAVQTIVRDISEQKRAEEALREANEALRTLIEAAPVAIIAFGGDGRVRLRNPAAERMLGWREEEVLGHVLPHISEETRGEHATLRQRVLSGEILTGIESRRRPNAADSHEPDHQRFRSPWRPEREYHDLERACGV